MQTTAYAHDRMAEACRAVGDATRVRILATVQGAGEICVCHVEQALGLTQSRTSRHLAALRRAGLVVDRRDGAWVYYQASRSGDLFTRSVLQMAREVALDPSLKADISRAKALRDAAGCADRGTP